MRDFLWWINNYVLNWGSHVSDLILLFNKAGYTANKQSLTGGQEQFADGQGQSFGGQGLYFGWAGAVMLRNHKFGQFRVVQNFL